MLAEFFFRHASASKHTLDSMIARAFRHPTRIGILRLLIAEPQGLSVHALADELQDDVAAVQRHAQELCSIGAIAAQRRETTTVYAVNTTPLAQTLTTMLNAMMPRPPTRAGPAAQVELDAVLSQMPSGVATYSRDGELIRLNAAGERIIGRRVIPGESARNRLVRYAVRRLDGTPMPEEESPSGRVRRHETFTNLECVIDGQQDAIIHLMTSGSPLIDERGEVCGAIVVFEDVTRERAFAREEAHHRLLTETIVEWAPIGIGLWDTSDEFRCTRHNRAYEQILGLDMDGQGSLGGVSLDDLFDESTRVRVRAIFEQVRATGVPFTVDEFPAVLRSERQPRWYRWSLTPLRDEGRIHALLTCVIEVTELVRAREQLRQHAANLQAVIAAMPEAVALADREGNILLANEVAERLWGQPVPRNLAAQDYAALFTCYGPDGNLLGRDEMPLARALEGETVIGQEVAYEQPKGTRLDLLCNAAPVYDESDNTLLGAVLIFQDITHMKELERQRDDFLSIAAHELRTPLTTILGTLHVMVRQLTRDQTQNPVELSKLVNGLDRMNRQALRIHKLVSDLLDTTRMHAGRLEFSMASTDIVAVVRDAIEGQRMAHPGRTVIGSLPVPPVHAVVDSARLAQVVDNLLSNALKYSAEDEPVEIALTIEGDVAHLQVTDRGPGIPTESQQRLFERFYRVPGVAVQSGSGVGLGLGLFITRSIVERHGGKVAVESSDGSGSTFHVMLPLS